MRIQLLPTFVLLVAATLTGNAFAAAQSARFASGSSPGESVSLASVHQKARQLGIQANEARREGVSLPVDLVPTVSHALSLGPHASREDLVSIQNRLVAYEDELDLLENKPGTLGRSTIDVPGTLVAGQSASFKQVYEAGTTLRAGAELAIARHWAYPWSLQTSMPDANNYVAVSTTGEAELGVESITRNGIHGGLYRESRLPLVKIEDGSLEPGDTITIEYGAGPRGFIVPEQAMDRFVLPLYLRRNVDNFFMTVPVHPIKVVGGPIERVTAVMPSRMTVGEPADLKVRLEDEYGNLATGEFPSLELLVNGVFQDRIPAGRNPMPVVENFSIDKTGIHRIRVQSSGGGIVGETNPVLVSEEAPEYRIRWLDLHRHSSRSDGVHSPSRIEDEALTDVELVIDHDNYLTRSDWQELARDHGVKGFEWSLPVENGGHHVVMSRNPVNVGDVLRATFPDLGRLVRGFNPDQTLVMALPEVPSDTRFQDPAMTRLVEIKAGAGTYEWMGNRFAKAGVRVGFTGSASSHISPTAWTSNRGITAVYVRDGEDWWDALRHRHTYVTSGPRMILRAHLNGELPGSRLSQASDRIIRGEVIGTAGIASIELLRNGKVIERRDHSSTTNGKTVRVSFKSDSRPWRDERDLPRNGREWIGYIKIKGPSIEKISAPGFKDSNHQAIALNPDQEGRVDFITWTKGQSSSFMLHLVADELDDAMLELNLKGGFEDIDYTPRTRGAQPIPPIRQQVSLEDLRSGEIVYRINVSGYQDEITFELVKPEIPERQSFEFTDTRDATTDYYYLRIRQIDDEYLWSTPFWVGGFDVH